MPRVTSLIRRALRPVPLLAIATACHDRLTAVLPAGSEPFSAPAAYRLWWQMAETCSGRTASFDRVQWYVVPGASSLSSTDTGLQGEWFADGNRIVLAGESQLDGSLVRHEMLHSLLGPAAANHPRDQFLGRCGGVVACDERCVADAGPPVKLASNTSVVSGDSMDLGVEVMPTVPSLSSYDGYFALSITAHNPAAHAVIVRLRDLDFTYRYHIRGPSLAIDGAGSPVDVGAIEFAPGETKRYTFDMTAVGNPAFPQIPPQELRVTGAFAGHEMTTPVRVTVAP